MDTDTLPRLTRRVGPAALGAVPVLRRLVQALFPQAPLAATHTALPGARSPSESSRTTVAAAVARAIIELASEASYESPNPVVCFACLGPRNASGFKIGRWLVTAP